MDGEFYAYRVRSNKGVVVVVVVRLIDMCCYGIANRVVYAFLTVAVCMWRSQCLCCRLCFLIVCSEKAIE